MLQRMQTQVQTPGSASNTPKGAALHTAGGPSRTKSGRRMHLCPFCREYKSNVSRHVQTCRTNVERVPFGEIRSAIFNALDEPSPPPACPAKLSSVFCIISNNSQHFVLALSWCPNVERVFKEPEQAFSGIVLAPVPVYGLLPSKTQYEYVLIYIHGNFYHFLVLVLGTLNAITMYL